MGEKEKILSKLNMKDYRNELELVLENKQFDEEAKSLILSIFYKIDNFYKDYSSVKVQTENKNKFLEEYIEIIKNKCNKIQVISPQECTKTKRYSIDIKKGEIKTFPNENILMYAIYELDEKNLDDLNIEFTNKCIINMLNKGKTINNIEPVRDFNGWSWNIEINNTKNIEYNLIFQNLLILFGYNFIFENINKSNIISLLKKEISNKSWKEKGYEFIECLLQILVILYNNNSIQNHEECLEYKKQITDKIKNLNNRKDYINNMTKNNSILIKNIQKIDILLNDINLIREEFQKNLKNNNSEYFCISDFVEAKENERKKMLEELENNNKLLRPSDFLKYQDNYKSILKIYTQIKEETIKINVQSKIIKLQKLFLECMKLKILNNDNKKDYYIFVKELRYYAFIPYKKNKNILMHEKLFQVYEDVLKVLVNKMLENKIIDLGFSNKDLNYDIIKYIFKSKIINLNNIILKINFIMDNKIEVEYYDGNMLETKESFEIPFDEEVLNKKGRKIKLFKIM